MPVIVSAHTDTVFPDGLDLNLRGSRLSGTLDNIAGVFAVMRAYPRLREMGVRAFFPRDEERLMRTETALAKRLLREREPPVCIAVDVDEVDDPVDVVVSNVSGLTDAQRKSVAESLEWHDLRFKVEDIDFSDPETADEAWAYARAGLPTFSLLIPVVGDYHTKDCHTSIDRIEKAAQALIWCCAALLE